VSAGAGAKAPELLRRALVVVDEIIELERVDLAGVVAGEPISDALISLASSASW
jgi:hypothetical protein